MSSNKAAIVPFEDDDQEVLTGESIDALMHLPVDRSKVVRLADSLMGIHPAAKEIGVIGMRTVAQLAIVTGANPLPGTNGIHAWIDNKGKTCVQFGIGFWTSKIEQNGGMAWVEKPRPMTDQERKDWSVQASEVAYICEAALVRNMRELASTVKQMGCPPLSYRDLKSEVSRVGIGIASDAKWPSGDYKGAKSGRPLGWSAKLSAERDLYRQLVSLGGIMDKQPEQPTPPAWEWELLPQPTTVSPDYDGDDFNEQFLGVSPAKPEPVVVKDDSQDEFWEDAVELATDKDMLAMALWQLDGAKNIFDDANEIKMLLTELVGAESFDRQPMVTAVEQFAQMAADGIDRVEAIERSRLAFLLASEEEGRQVVLRGTERDVHCKVDDLVVFHSGNWLFKVTAEGKQFRVGYDKLYVDYSAI